MGMLNRCNNENDKSYHNYGGRGIKVFKEWEESYPAFLASVGRRPNDTYSLGRIDNDRGYEPGNVRWETDSEQQNNTRRNRIVEINGEKRTATQWARMFGVNIYTFIGRLNRGTDPLMALSGGPCSPQPDFLTEDLKE